MLRKYYITNVDCAECASNIELQLNRHHLVKSAQFNFAAGILQVDTDEVNLVHDEIKRVKPEAEIQSSNASTQNKYRSELEHPAFKKTILKLAIICTLFIIQLVWGQAMQPWLWGFGDYPVSLAAYFLAGWSVFKAAGRTIRSGHFFDENILMILATAGAIAIHELSEAIGVMFFYQIGELLQTLTVTRSRRSIQSLLQLRPDSATLKTKDGLRKVSPEEVNPGDTIIVRAGEKVPLDGVVENGQSFVNSSALTGESVPEQVSPGDCVLAGQINVTSLLTMTVTKSVSDSSIAKIVDLIENATARKAPTERFITKFARYYTPVIVVFALCVALLPPIFAADQLFSEWLYRALVLLVISCPCALVVSIPLGYFAGVGAASRKGILVKGSDYLDRLASLKTVVFDKTGTLTNGVFKVLKCNPADGCSEEQLLSSAALAESHSNHPIAKSITEAVGNLNQKDTILDYKEIPGLGIKVTTGNQQILVGNETLMHQENIQYDKTFHYGTIVYVAVDNKYIGNIIIGDEIKKDSFNIASKLKRVGVSTIAMLSGDKESSVKGVADALGLDFYHAQLLPEDKVRYFEKTADTKKHEGEIAFVGDGINDAPVLAMADVGIAMGAFGADVSIDTADVVLMNDKPSSIVQAILISKKVKTIVIQNIVLALAVKIAFVVFGVVGLAGMWEAVFADVGVTILAVLNATRVLKRGMK